MWIWNGCIIKTRKLADLVSFPITLENDLNLKYWLITDLILKNS